MINVSTEYMDLVYLDSTKNKCVISYGLYDVTAQSTATATANTKQDFSNLNDTLTDLSTTDRYSTLERNEWLLDGNTKVFPNNPNNIKWGWWSKYQSNDEGLFDINPKITYTWSSNHSSAGITLKFVEPIKRMKASWYNGSNVLLGSEEYTNEDYTQTEYILETSIENYRKLEIEIIETMPNHYSKLLETFFGVTVIWDSEIITFSINESLDPKCSEITSNQLEISLNNLDNRFNKYNPNNQLRFLQEEQKIDVKSKIYINGNYEIVPLGTYYLTSWGNPTEYTSRFIANDLAYKLKGQYYKSKFYTDATAETILTDLFNACNLYSGTEPQFVIDDNVKNVTLTGYIPITDYRNALQQICFSLGAVCKCDREGKLYIYRLSENQKVEDIGFDKKAPSVDNEGTKYSGVTLTQYSYSIGQTETLFNDTVTGDQIITFNKRPATNISVTGTYTSFDVYANCVYIKGASGSITVTGKPYEIYSKERSKVLEDTTIGITKQMANITEIYLISSESTVTYILNWLLNELQRTITNEFKWLGNPAIEIGDFVNVEVQENLYKKSLITKNKFEYNGALMEKSEVVM